MLIKLYERIINSNIKPSITIITIFDKILFKINNNSNKPQKIQDILQSINRVKIYLTYSMILKKITIINSFYLEHSKIRMKIIF